MISRLPVISALLVSTIILLDENGCVSFGLLLPLTTLVTPIGLLDHSRGMIKFPLLTIGQGQPTEVGLVPIGIPIPVGTIGKFPLGTPWIVLTAAVLIVTAV